MTKPHRESTRRLIGIGAVLALTTFALLIVMSLLPGSGTPYVAASGVNPGTITHTTTSDFQVCTVLSATVNRVLTNTFVSQGTGGEVRLAAILEDNFDGAAIDTTKWITYEKFMGPPIIGDGVVTFTQSGLRSLSNFTQTARAVEASVRFRSVGSPDLALFGLGRQNQPATPATCPGDPDCDGATREFATDSSNLYSVAWDGYTATDIFAGIISGYDLTQFHAFKIVWTSDQARFYVDGTPFPTGTFTSTQVYTPYVWFSSMAGSGTIVADWVRVLYYPTPTGQYESCVVDSAQASHWTTLSWTSDVPAGTSASLETRSSVDGSAWSAWTAVSGSGGSIASPNGRYLQYRASLTTTDANASPEIRSVSASYELNEAPIANPLSPTTTTEGSTVDLSGSGSDPNGDAIAYEWDLNYVTPTFDVDSTISNPSVLFSDGPHTRIVALRLKDSLLTGAIQTTTITVNNAAPTISSTGGTTPIDEGGSSTISVSATDPAGVNDPLTYEFDCDNDLAYEIGPQAGNSALCAYTDNGSKTVNVRVSDGDGGSDTDSTTVTVNNVAPTISSASGSGPIDEGGSSTITVAASDPAGGNDPLLYEFDCDNNTVYEIGPQSGNSTLCASTDDGSMIVNVRVSDGDGGSDTDSTTVTVNNVAPSISSTGATTPIDEGGSSTVTVTASDPAGASDPLQYEFDCDNNLAYEIGPQSGNSASCSYTDDSSKTVNVRVSDGDGGSDIDSTGITVNNVAPTISSTGATTPIDEGDSATITVSASDPAGGSDPLQYEFDCDNNSVYEIGPQPGSSTLCAYADDGTQTINVRVTDGDGGSDTDSASVTVNNVDPTISSVSGTTPINEGSSSTISMSATDPAGVNDPLQYEFDCDNAGGYEIGPQPGTSTLCAYADNGTKIINVRVTDDESGVQTGFTTITVTNVAPSASFSAPTSANEGTSFSLSLTGPTDPSSVDTAAGFTYNFNCGLGYIGFGASNTASCPTTDNGIRTVNGQIRDKDGGATTYTATVTVNNVAPTISSVSGTTPINEGGSSTISVSASDPAGASDPLTYEFDCDNSGSYEIGPQAGSSALCAYTDNGTMTVNVRVTDGDGGSDTDSTAVTVNNVIPTATFNAPTFAAIGDSFDLSLTNPVEPGSVDSAGLQYAFDCGGGAGYGAFSGTTNVTCPATIAGDRTVKGKIKDKDGGTSEYMASVSIRHLVFVPAVMRNTGSPRVVTAGQAIDWLMRFLAAAQH